MYVYTHVNTTFLSFPPFRLPAVLAPHGGPHAAITASWFLPYAYLAALGYAVVVPNYRGSTGEVYRCNPIFVCGGGGR